MRLLFILEAAFSHKSEVTDPGLSEKMLNSVDFR